MCASIKAMPFHIFQNHCDDRHFSYMGMSGKFFVTCKQGFDKCNFRVCPVWNSQDVRDVGDDLEVRGNQENNEPELSSLRDINMRLKSYSNSSPQYAIAAQQLVDGSGSISRKIEEIKYRRNHERSDAELMVDIDKVVAGIDVDAEYSDRIQ